MKFKKIFYAIAISLWAISCDRSKKQDSPTEQSADQRKGIAISHSTKIIAFQENGKFGLKDSDGKILAPCIYDSIKGVDETTITGLTDKICPVKKNAKWGLMDSHGKVITDFVYDKILPEYLSPEYFKYFFNGYVKARKSDSLCLVDESGREVLKCLCDDVKGLEAGVISIRQGNKWSLFDPSINQKISNDYDLFYGMTNGIIAVENAKKFGFISRTGEVITDCIFDRFAILNNKFIILTKDKKNGFILGEGEHVLPCIYETNAAVTFSNKFVDVKKDGTWIKINDEGEEIR